MCDCSFVRVFIAQLLLILGQLHLIIQRLTWRDSLNFIMIIPSLPSKASRQPVVPVSSRGKWGVRTRQISCPDSLPGSHQSRLAGKLPVLGAPACALLACTLTYTSLGHSSLSLRMSSVNLMCTLLQSFTYKIWILKSFYSMHFSFSSFPSASHKLPSISPRCAARP